MRLTPQSSVMSAIVILVSGFCSSSRFSDASSACFVMLDITRSSSPAACLLFLPGILYTIPPSPRRNPSFPMPVKSRSFHKSAWPCRSVQRPTGPPGHIPPPASAAGDAPSSSSRTPCPSFGEGCGVNSIVLGDNSKAYGDNSKGYGDRIHPYKKV